MERSGSGGSSTRCCWSACSGPNGGGREMAWSLPDGSVFGIFARQPEPGRVKTRLAAAYGPETSAAIYEAMLFDLLDLWSTDRVPAPGGRRVVVFDPPDAGPWFDA